MHGGQAWPDSGTCHRQLEAGRPDLGMASASPARVGVGDKQKGLRAGERAMVLRLWTVASAQTKKLDRPVFLAFGKEGASLRPMHRYHAEVFFQENSMC